MLKGFRDFIARGNVVDLAVAVVLGAAFTAVINAVVTGLINPLIAAIFGEPDLTSVGTFTLNGAVFSIGLILDAIVSFLLIAAAIYFVVIVPMNRMLSLRKKADEEVAAPADDVRLLEEIRDLLRDRPVA
jgi:large conductance mechanosensitive channel